MNKEEKEFHLSFMPHYHFTVTLKQVPFSRVSISIKRDGETVHAESYDYAATWDGLTYNTAISALFYRVQNLLVGCARRCHDTEDRFFAEHALIAVDAYYCHGASTHEFACPIL